MENAPVQSPMIVSDTTVPAESINGRSLLPLTTRLYVAPTCFSLNKFQAICQDLSISSKVVEVVFLDEVVSEAYNARLSLDKNRKQRESPISSRDLLASGPLVLTFYRGVWCPFCNEDLKALEAERPGDAIFKSIFGSGDDDEIE